MSASSFNQMSECVGILASIFMRKSCIENVLYATVDEYSSNATTNLTGTTETVY
jgi:hypothetical protein